MPQTLSGTGTDVLQAFDLLDGSVRFTLPKRGGVFRWIGLAMTILPVLFALVPLGIIASEVRNGTSILLLIMPAAIMLPALGIMLLGLAILVGRSEMTLTRTHLHYAERLGPLRKRWSRRLEDIASLRINTLEPASQNNMPAAMRPFAAIAIESNNGKTLTVGFGHTRDTLEPLTEQISQRAEAFRGSPVPINTTAPTDPPATVDSATGQPLTLDDLPAPPANATVTVNRNETGMTVHVPPAGWRGTKGLLSFSLLWCAFMTIFTGVAVSLPTSHGFGSDWWLFAAFILGFWAIGIGMFVIALNMAKRQAIVDIIGDTLVVSRQSLFSTKQHEWTADQIRQIVVAPSGLEVNNRPVLNLQIVPRQGKVVGLFNERDDNELQWIAQALTVGLGLTQATESV